MTQVLKGMNVGAEKEQYNSSYGENMANPFLTKKINPVEGGGFEGQQLRGDYLHKNTASQPPLSYCNPQNQRATRGGREQNQPLPNVNSAFHSSAGSYFYQQQQQNPYQSSGGHQQ